MERIYVITENGIVEKTDSEMDYIREISSKDELEELMERMPYIQTIQAPNSKLRKELYTLAMKTYWQLSKKCLFSKDFRSGICGFTWFEEMIFLTNNYDRI